MHIRSGTQPLKHRLESSIKHPHGGEPSRVVAFQYPASPQTWIVAIQILAVGDDGFYGHIAYEQATAHRGTMPEMGAITTYAEMCKDGGFNPLP